MIAEIKIILKITNTHRHDFIWKEAKFMRVGTTGFYYNIQLPWREI